MNSLYHLRLWRRIVSSGVYALCLLLTVACQNVGKEEHSELAQAKEELRNIRVKGSGQDVVAQLDSLSALGRRYQDDSLRQASELKKVEYYLALYELAPADSLLASLRGEELVSPALRLELYARHSVAELIRDDIQKAIGYQRQAIAYGEQHLEEVDHGTLNSLYINTTMSYSYTDKVDSMRYFLARGYELAERRRDSIKLADCYAQEASIYSNAFDDERCAEFLSKAIDLTSGQSDRFPNKNLYRLNLGMTLYNAMEVEGVSPERLDSIRRVMTAMLRSEEQHLRRGYVLAHGYKVLSYVYTVDKQYPEAERYLLMADSLTDDPTLETEVSKVQLLIKVENKQRPYQAEATRLETSLARGLVGPSAQVEGYKVLQRAYAEAGQAQEALRINDSVDKYQDSLRAEHKYREVMKLERGRALNEAKSKLDQERGRSRTLLYWLVGIAVCAIVLIVGLYYHHRCKHRRLEDAGRQLRSELEESHVERERVAQELEQVRQRLQSLSRAAEPIGAEGSESEPKLSPEVQDNIGEALRLLMQEQCRYRDKNLTLEMLASLVGANRSYVSSYLNRVLGDSYSDYIAKLRLAEAKQLLRETDETLPVIASRVGFSTLQTFHAQFKKHNEGMTPTEYRAKVSGQ
ncbi:MAG: helix-turn-helix transcriptional regulator [Porphyromonas sp.]|nr:helix-turn-helix transcriptional regulator [Porphyromonas sp.]